MPNILTILAPVAATAVKDLYAHMVDTKGINTTTTTAIFSADAVLKVMEQMGNGVDLTAAFQTGDGWMAAAAAVLIGLRFALYLWRKAKGLQVDAAQ